MFDKTGIGIAAEHRRPCGYSGDGHAVPSPLGEKVPEGRMRGAFTHAQEQLPLTSSAE
jgi:hypothetical protein